MKTDPTYQRLLETSWQRDLDAPEQRELEAWLAKHPEAGAEWQADAALNAALARLPDAPMPSNFTARVLQSAAREARQPDRSVRWTWLSSWLPRAAFALFLAAAGLFSYSQVKKAQRLDYAQSLEAISAVAAVPSPQALEDFDAIYALGHAPAADRELLSLLQ